MTQAINIIEGESSDTGIVNSTDAHIDLFFKMNQRINAKSEEISKAYSNNVLVKLSDISELHYKTIQSIESLKPIKSEVNTRIVVSHNEGESEKFNSFNAFEKRNLTNPNPTSDIILIYSFSIYCVESDEFENYKVICHVCSRIAELQQFEKEAPPFISSALIASMVTITAKITIHYSDYVKARHFTAMFDEWIRGCDESKNIKFIDKLKKVSHLIKKIGRFVIIATLSLYTIFSIGDAEVSANMLLKFLVAYAAVFVIVAGIAELVLIKLEKSIDSYLPMSYLDINKGDSKLIKKFENRNAYSVIWSVISVVGAICVGLATSATYDFIKWLIS